ncbi:MAG TPA: deoxynucleoside kinase [Solirubrobacterales bacterium]|nr:deoxynucleoside kinase [Solirubrobacterales bacterium]
MRSEPEAAAIERNERRIQADSEPRQSIVVGVVGPIGAGKSTLASGLAESLGFRLFTERVEDNPFFTRFAADPPTWVFRSQLAFMLNAVADAVEARRSGGAVIERPVHEMHAIFVRDQLRNRLITEQEELLLRQLVEIGDRAGGRPDLLVAVAASPEVLYERITNRARPGEEHYSREYIERLARSYDDWLRAWPSSLIEIDSETRDIRERTTIDDLAAEIERHWSAQQRVGHLGR